VHESVADLARAERALGDPSGLEDASRDHRRYRQRDGSQDACRLGCERGMPKSSASGEEWAAWHQSRTGSGGYDPRSLIR
jgi:hypothetical protein